MQLTSYTILHLFCGAGGGGLGGARARAEQSGHAAHFRTLGGVDVDPLACQDFERLVQAPALCADVAALQPAELRRAFGEQAPDMVLTSPPCKGFSALLPRKRAEQPKYQALNRLVLQGVHLVLSTWDPGPRVIFLENVPRIVSRGRELLAQVHQLLHAHGYVVAQGTHDCGEVGGLGQHRRRYFLIARNTRRMGAFVYVPPRQRVHACGEILSALPVPGLSGEKGGVMHELPKLSMLNLARLAAIPAGGDWRDLPGVVPTGGKRREQHRRHMVVDWAEPAPTIGGAGSNGAAAVADPRLLGHEPRSGAFGVLDWQAPAQAVTGYARPGGSNMPAAVADPRALALGATADGAVRFKGSPGLFGVLDWGRPAQAVTGNAQVSGSNTPAAVADPRANRYLNNFRVLAWEESARTVASASRPGSGAASVADPRALKLGCAPRAGAYGVLRWDEAAALVAGNLRVDNGRASVADPRVRHALDLVPSDPRKAPRELLIVIAPDGTWHRPLTTLELAALQSFPAEHNGEPLVLAGRSHTRWRQAIGDAIPPAAAQAVCEQILEALLASDCEAFRLRVEPIWVRGGREGAVIV